MNLVCRGSILVLVMFVMTIVTVCALNLWRSSWYAGHLMSKQLQHEQRFQATQGLLTYGLALVREHFETLCERAKEDAYITEFSVVQWPVGNTSSCDGTIELSARHDHVMLT